MGGTEGGHAPEGRAGGEAERGGLPPLPLGEGWGEGGGAERGAPTSTWPGAHYLPPSPIMYKYGSNLVRDDEQHDKLPAGLG